jgi:O-antigen/teichoic acid export membrane protein
MRSRVLWRRSATAAGLYASVALGIIGSIVAANVLGKEKFGVFALAMAVAGFFQILLDLTVEDALTKVGFRYIAAEEWGKLHRLFAVAARVKLAGGALATLAILALAPFADLIFEGAGITEALVAVALLPLVQAPENVASTALLLRSRYDIRGAYLSFAQGLRLAGLAIGVTFGVVPAIVGIVVAQVISSAVVSWGGRRALRRFPSEPQVPLTEDRREIFDFVARSSIATGVVAGRTALVPVLLGLVAPATQVGLLRVAMTPQSGFAAASAPVRLILLTEQTRDWEHGGRETIFQGLRRYMVWSTTVMIVAVPIFLALMGWLIELFYPAYTDATTAARVILFAAAIQLVFGWAKSLPTTIGRPGLRILAHGIETAVLIPLVLILGASNGVTGAAVAILISSIVFALVWVVLLLRLRRESLEPEAQPA